MILFGIGFIVGLSFCILIDCLLPRIPFGHEDDESFHFDDLNDPEFNNPNRPAKRK